MTTAGRRKGRLFLETTLGLIIGLGILLGVAIYYLSTGPVSISGINPRLEAVLNQPNSPVRFKIADTRLTWAGWDRAIDVVALNVTVSDRNDTPLALLPEVSIGISTSALLYGALELSTVEILNPSVTLSLGQSGRIGMAIDTLGTQTQEAEGSSHSINVAMPNESGLIPASVLEMFATNFETVPILSTLKQFNILDAEIQLQDAFAQDRLWMRRTNLSMQRADEGTTIFLETVLEDSAGAALPVNARIVPDRSAGIVKVVFSADRFNPIDIDRKVPSLAGYLPAIPIGLAVEATLGLDGHVRNMRLDADSPMGALSAQAVPDGSFPATIITMSYKDLNAAEWLSAIGALSDFADYVPREAASGTLFATLDEDGSLVLVDAKMDTEIGQMALNARQEPETEALSITAAIKDVRLDRAAQTAPLLAALVGIEAPLNADLEARLAFDGTPLDAALTINLGSGKLRVADLHETLPEIAQASARITLEQAPAPIVLERLRVVFPDNPVVTVQGEIFPVAVGETSAGTINLNATLKDLSFENLADFWPVNMGANPRAWILENMPSARVSEATMGVGLLVPDWRFDQADATRLSGGITFSDAIVHYLRPLSPAIDVAGRAQFDLKRFDISLTQGRVEDATIAGAELAITGLETGKEVIDVKATVDSSLETAFALLDAEPRRYISKLGMTPTAIDGTARAQLAFKLPLLRALEAEQVFYAAEATLRNVRLPQPQFDIIVTAEEASLSLVPGSLNVAGTMRLGDIPAKVQWTENFDDNAEPIKAFRINAEADISQLAAFGPDVSRFASGPADVELFYSERRDGVETIALSGDLSRAVLSIDAIKWRKPADAESTMSLDAFLYPDQSVRIENFLLSGKEHVIDMSADLSDGGQTLRQATIHEFQLGLTQFQGKVEKRDAWYVADLRGQQLDLGVFLSDDAEVGDPDLETPASETPKISITGEFDALSDGPERAVSDTNLRIDIEGESVSVLTLTGKLAADKALDLRYIPNNSGGHTLSVLAADTGIALRVADVTGRLEGGTLSIEGTRPGPDDPLSGRLVLNDFILSEAPRLTRVLQALSVTGLLTAFTADEGLAIDSMVADFVLTQESVTIEDAAVTSPSIGLVLNGTVDRKNDVMDLRGDIAIKDILTRTIGQLPVLDFLLGDGLVGAAFTMKGPIEEPDISVNPLSVLAPGFLRKVFSADIEGNDVTPVPGEERTGGQ